MESAYKSVCTCVCFPTTQKDMKRRWIFQTHSTGYEDNGDVEFLGHFGWLLGQDGMEWTVKTLSDSFIYLITSTSLVPPLARSPCVQKITLSFNSFDTSPRISIFVSQPWKEAIALKSQQIAKSNVANQQHPFIIKSPPPSLRELITYDRLTGRVPGNT